MFKPGAHVAFHRIIKSDFSIGGMTLQSKLSRNTYAEAAGRFTDQLTFGKWKWKGSFFAYFTFY